MYVRIWEYDVHPTAVDRFVAAYAAGGDWAQLFARGHGFLGTELFRSAEAPARFVTIDRWRDRSAWNAFSEQWDEAYRALDARMEVLTTSETDLFDGSVAVATDPSTSGR